MTQKVQHITDDLTISLLCITIKKREYDIRVNFRKEPNGEMFMFVSFEDKKHYASMETPIDKHIVDELREFLEKGDD